MESTPSDLTTMLELALDTILLTQTDISSQYLCHWSSCRIFTKSPGMSIKSRSDLLCSIAVCRIFVFDSFRWSSTDITSWMSISVISAGSHIDFEYIIISPAYLEFISHSSSWAMKIPWLWSRILQQVNAPSITQLKMIALKTSPYSTLVSMGNVELEPTEPDWER